MRCFTRSKPVGAFIPGIGTFGWRRVALAVRRVVAALSTGGLLPRRISAATVLAVAALAVTAGPVQAQTAVKLVGNAEKWTSGFTFLFMFDLAQPFTTGSNAAGYTLSSIEIDIVAPSNPALRVSLWSMSSGIPTSKVADLSNPSDFSAEMDVFTASPGTKLQKDTTYAVVVRGRKGFLPKTSWQGEEADGQADWFITDGSLYTVFNDRGTWRPTLAATSVMRIRGERHRRPGEHRRDVERAGP